MACGCRGKSGPLPVNRLQAVAARSTARVAVYEVTVGGDVKLSTTSPSAARTEAKRLRGSVRVTSRPVSAGDPGASQEELAG